MGRDEWMAACVTVGPMAIVMALLNHFDVGSFTFGMTLLGAGMLGWGLGELYRKVRKQGAQLEKILSALERR